MMKSATTWIDLEGIALSEISQTEEDKCHVICCVWTLEKQNKQAEQKWIHRYRKHSDGCQMGGGSEGWVKKVEGLRSRNWYLQNSYRSIKYSTGNTVNIVITMYGIRWVLDLSGRSDHLVSSILSNHWVVHLK